MESAETWLTETVHNRNHEILFFPKFHCELNFIEMVWGYLKAKLLAECEFSFTALKEKVPAVLDKMDAKLFRKFSMHCFRFMNGYRMKMQGPLLDYAVRKYKSHRCFPSDCTLEKFEKEYKNALKIKMEKTCC